MANNVKAITDNLDLWTSALLTKSTAGRGSNGRVEAYGIKKLRELILELAVRGKLVDQDINDESAIEVLRRTTRAVKPIDVKTQQEVPTGWVSIPLACTIASNVGGGTPSKQNPSYWNGEISWASVKDIQADKYLTATIDSITEDGLKASSSNLIPPDRLLIVTRMGLGKLAINKIPVAINQDLRAIEPNEALNLDFAYLLFKALKLVGKGVTVKGITVEELHSMTIALPPLAEQHRIVAKVDELMALCDQLEQQQTNIIEAHQTLVETLLGTLTSVASHEEFAEAWTRIADHFDTLFTTEQGIDQLKQTILQLAVMGKLDEGVSGGWETHRLDKVCSVIVDCPHSTPKWTDTGKICIRTSQFKPGKLDLSRCRFVSESTFAERVARLKPEADDILYSREGGILGVACRVPPKVELCLGQRMMLMRPASRIVSPFLELVLNSPVINDIARQNTTGGAAPRVNVSTVKSYPIPVPPLAEQHRIVAKVDELMALCDALKARLAAAQTTQTHLADAIVEQAVA